MISVGKAGSHDKLKEYYKRYLENKGYKVDLEKHILNGKYIIDVYGEKEDDVILVEIGTIQRKGKIEELRDKFKNVVHVPYLDDWLSYPWPDDGLKSIPDDVKRESIRRMGASLR